MAVMKLMATIKREKNVFSAGMIEDIKDNLLKRLKNEDPDFAVLREKKDLKNLNEEAKKKLDILEVAAKAICTEAGIPRNETNKYKGWILSLIGASRSGVGFRVTGERLEDGPALIDNLTKYHKLIAKGKKIEKDIFKIKSVGDLTEAVKDYKVSDSDKIMKQKWKAFFQNGEELPGSTVLFKNGSYSVYHVEEAEPDTINALIKMSGKDPDEVKDKGNEALRLSNCTWCTAHTEHAEYYLENYISLTMFYKNGEPLYELLGAKKESNQWEGESGNGEFHDAQNRDKNLTELAQLIRTMGMPKENREKIWAALIISPKIADDIIDHPEEHAKAK